LWKEIEAGAPFDVALLPRPELDALVQAGKIAHHDMADVTRSAVGLAVRLGAAKPDIGTVDAFKRALIAARSIGYSDGPSGAYIASLLERLGIACEMKPRTRLTSGPVAELVASGEVEIGMGVELVGPLPSELQNVIIYAAGRAAGAQNAASAQNFITFMRGHEVQRMIRAKGMEPG
jgi:molybdate transport system substrate-binding protein